MPAPRNVGPFGTKLREARERRGLSLRQIANDTKISVAALEALEREDIARLPGGIFSRAFVRAYADAVGLDPESSVEEFVRGFPQESVTAGHSSFRASGADDGGSDGGRRAASVAYWVLGLAVPLAAVITYLGMGHRGATPGSAVASAGRPDQAGAPRNGLTDRFGGFLVELTASRVSDVLMEIDEQPPLSVSLAPHAPRSFEGRRGLTLTTNDAGAITWSINGSVGRLLGTDGERRSVHVTPDNLRDLLASR